jgi:hypothetical protein
MLAVKDSLNLQIKNVRNAILKGRVKVDIPFSDIVLVYPAVI